MVEQNSLFRKSALDKLASPERLDVLMQVTSPQGWLALVTISVVLAATLIWSIVGRLPDTLAADGMLILGEGNRVITAGDSAGTIEELRISVGSTVQVDDVVAVIAASATSGEEIRLKQAEVRSAESNYNNSRFTAEAEKRSHETNIRSWQAELDSRGQQRDAEEARLPERQQALDEGRIARNAFQAFMNNLNSLRSQVIDLETRIRGSGVEIQALDDQIQSGAASLQQLRRELGAMQSTAVSATEVKSPVSGRVVSLPKQVGDLVARSETIAALGESDGTLQATMFVAEAQAGQIELGMAVELDFSPTIRREDFGMLKGTVTEIGQVGASQDEIERIMASGTGTQAILELGATRLIRVALDADPSTTSGFAWTMSGGPDRTLVAPTPLVGSITYDSRRPITHVVPKRAIDAAEGLWKSAFGG